MLLYDIHQMLEQNTSLQRLGPTVVSSSLFIFPDFERTSSRCFVAITNIYNILYYNVKLYVHEQTVYCFPVISGTKLIYWNTKLFVTTFLIRCISAICSSLRDRILVIER